ncbi:MAG: peptidase S9, partial [Bacteroidales bacterium]|nr:peptidase S9 [Bacteroidales bacterium]
MKRISIIAMITATALISGCNSPKEEPQEFIGKQEVSLSSDLMTPEALWAMGRIGGVQPSPDGSKILYNVSYYSVKENRSHTVICLMNADGSDVKTLTKS